MVLSVIMCVRNEKDTILEIVDRVQKVDLGSGWSKDIIIVDNLSTDGTREILRTLDGKNGIRVIYQTVNLGKSHSVRTAIPLCKGDYAIPQDADLEYNPKDYKPLIDKALMERLDVVIGSRSLGGGRYHVYRVNELGIKVLTWITNILFGTEYSDVATCYKLMRTELLKSFKLQSNAFNLDFELSAKFAKHNIKVGEVAIDYQSRTFEQGRQMKAWRNGIQAFWVIIRERLTK